MPANSLSENEFECIRCHAIAKVGMKKCPRCGLNFFPEDGKGEYEYEDSLIDNDDLLIDDNDNDIKDNKVYKNKYAPPPNSKSKYGALRGIASLCTGLGWLIIGLAGIGAIVSLVLPDPLAKFAGVIISVIIGGFSFIILRVIAESISVLVDIEANTRLAATKAEKVETILKQHLK
jgi:hypothetical protein